MESVTLKLDKEGGTVSTAKISSYLSPHRLGGLSGKGLSLESGKAKILGTAQAVAHKVDTAGERPRIKTVLTVSGNGGFNRFLGREIGITIAQLDLPGMQEEEEEEED
jgi:hypothetical protein